MFGNVVVILLGGVLIFLVVFRFGSGNRLVLKLSRLIYRVFYLSRFFLRFSVNFVLVICFLFYNEVLICVSFRFRKIRVRVRKSDFLFN